MAEKDDFNLDDFNLDNFDDDFDFDGGFDTYDPGGDRSAVTRLAFATKSSLKEKVRSPSFFAKILKAAAPSKFSAIFEAGEAIARGSESLYNKAIEDASPAGKVLGRQLRKALPGMRGLMSEKMYSNLDEALKEEEGYRPPSKEEQTEEAVAGVMSEFAEKQATRDKIRYTEEGKRFAFSQRAESLRHSELVFLAKTQVRNQRREISFNEKVMYKIHRKQLEVQFRSLFAIRDMTELNREGQRLMLEQLKMITKHTALPDAVKLRNSELFGQMMRESLFNRVQSTFGDGSGISQVIDNITGAVSKKVSNTIKELSEVITQLGDTADMVDEDMMYMLGGDMIADKLGEGAGGFAGKVLEKNKKFRRWSENKGARLARNTAEFGNSAAEWFRMNPETLDDKDKRWYKGNTDFGGVDKDGNPIELGGMQKIGGFFAKMLRDVGSDAINYKDNLTIRNADQFMGRQAIFTNKVATSITDVIPALLSMQLSELVHARTGSPGALQRYDYGNGKFITEEQNRSNVSAALRNAVSPGTTRRYANEAIDDIDKRKELNDETRTHLRRQLLLNSYQKRTLDAKNYSRPEQFHESIPMEQRQILIEFFKKNYTFSDNDPNNRFRDNRIAKAKRSYADLGRLVPAVLDELQRQYLAGNGDYLVEIGAMKRDGSGTTFDPDFVLKMIDTYELSDSDAEDTQTKVRSALTEAILAGVSSAKGALGNATDKAAEFVNSKMEEHGIYDKVVDFASDASRRASVLSRWNARKAKRAFNRFRNDGWREEITRKLKDRKDKGMQQAAEVYEKMNRFVTDRDFRDEVTGEVISRLEDLKGNIVDKDGNLLITKEDVMNKIDDLLKKPGFSAEVYDKASKQANDLQEEVKARLDEMGVTAKFDELKGEAEKKIEEAKTYDYKQAWKEGKEKAKGMFSRIRDNIMSKIARGEGLTEAELAAGANLMEDPIAPIGTNATLDRGTPMPGSPFGSPDVIDRLERLIKLAEGSNGFLEAIATKEIGSVIMQGGVDPKLIESLLRQRNPGLLRTLASGGIKLGAGLMSAAGSSLKIAGAMGGVFAKGIKMVGGAALDTAGWMWGGTKRMLGFYSDIYVRGDKVPALDAKGLNEGIYQDVLTGKRIKTYKDITGPVMNLKTNKIQLTQEEFDRGLYDYKGKPILGNLVRKIGAIYSGLLTPFAMGAKAIGAASRAVYGAVFNNPDVYSKDDLATPKLYAKLMENDQYNSKRTGKPVRSFKDIDGEVIDADGNVCLTLSDIRKGLCDYRGKALKSNFDRFIFNPAKAVIRTGIGLGVTGVKMGWGMLKGLGRVATNLLSGVKKGFFNGKEDEAKLTAAASLQTTDLLAQILDLLDERLPGKKTRGDTDGDGIREGSAEDIRRSRAAKKDSEKQDAEKDKEGGGFLSKLKSVFGGIFGGKDKDGEEDEGEDGDTYIGADMSTDGGDDDKKKKGKRGKQVNRRGRMTPPGLEKSGWWQKTKSFFARGFGGKAARAVGRFGKRALVVGAMGAAGMALGGTIGAVLAGAAALLGAPIIGAALAIGTVGWLAYEGYKWFKKPSGWEELLYAHYGIKNPTGEQVEAIKLLSEDMESSFKADGDKSTCTIKKDTLIKAAEQFGVKGDNELRRFMQWVAGRVRPVFLRLRTALYATNPRLKLMNADSLPNPQMLVFLKRIQLVPGAMELYKDPPFPVEQGQEMYSRDIDAVQRKYMKEIADKVGTELENSKGNSDSENAAFVATDIDGSSEAKMTDQGKQTKGAAVTGFAATSMSAAAANREGGTSRVEGSMKLTDPKMVGVDKIRYFAYGLKELEATRVATLRSVEEDIAATVKFGRNNTPFIGGSDKDFLELYAPRFGVNLADSKDTVRWLTWFHKRFLRVLFAFVTEVKITTGATTDFFARARTLSPANMGAIGMAMINAKNSGWFGKPIWAITESPWNDYVLLNEAKGPYNICLDLMTVQDEGESAAKFATRDKDKAVGSSSTTGQMPSVSGANGKGLGLYAPTTSTGAETPKDSQIYQSGVTRASTGSPTATSNPGGAPALADMTPSQNGDYSGLKEKQRVTAKTPIGNYILPTSGVVSSSFKMRAHPTLGVTRRHAGIDIAAPQGTEVYAINDGVIAAIGNQSGLGKFIFINHPDGYQSRYLHLHSFHSTVKKGLQVSKGQLIGTVGMTGGQSSGNHLHLAIVKGTGTGTNVEFVDPAAFYDSLAKQGPSKEETETDGGDIPIKEGDKGVISTTAPVGATKGNNNAPSTAVDSAKQKALGTVPELSTPAKSPASASQKTNLGQGGPDLNDMIESNGYMQQKIQRIDDENRKMGDHMRQAVTHLASIDKNMAEMVGLMRAGTGGGGSTSQANKPPQRTAKANVVSFKK